MSRARPSEARRCVHRNTVRYRISRLRKLCNTDLLSPVERLVLELQVNLLGED
jgi:DNA-binding PucR family transcriptional regulator